MTTIDTLKIGPFVFAVRFIPDPRNVKGEAVDGNLFHGEGWIEVDSQMSEQAQLHVLLHEVIHERLEIQCGHDLGEYAEQMIDAIGFCWIEIMRDNPELAKMIMK
jgi:hypothetical protein